MIKIVVGGQIEKETLAKYLETYGQGKIEVEIASDMDAAFKIKFSKADYYFGACSTGAGGALAMAIVILGEKKCAVLSTPEKISSDEDILKSLREGRKAFGFTPKHAEHIIKTILDELLSK